MAGTMHKSSYTFPGIREFFEAPAGVDPSVASRVPSLWFVCRAVDALSQIPACPPEHRSGMYKVVRDQVAALNAATQTVIAAMDEVMRHCPPLGDPEDPPVPQSDPLASLRPAPAAVEPITDTPLTPAPEPQPAPAKPARKVTS